MTELYYIIVLPILAGILLFFFPEKTRRLKGLLALAVAGVTAYFSIRVYGMDPQTFRFDCFAPLFQEGSVVHHILSGASSYFLIRIDGLSQLITLGVAFFTVVILVYSLASFTKQNQIHSFYAYFLITLGSSIGAVLVDNLLLFLFFWGVLGITLYKLIKGYDKESSAAAKKSLIMIGTSDGIMILGIALVWSLTGNLNMSEITVSTTSSASIVAFIALLVGSFTKAGAFPFHSWIPDYTHKAPGASSAYLPASLDKLLGIYFLARICNGMFDLNEWLQLLLIVLGVLTIITAGLMAMVQTNYKKLLGFSTVSQVGYMVIGFGLGTALGMAAGLFHMVNHAMYKSGLFLSAGSISKQTGQEDIDDLGGLSRAMPFTFIATLIFALSTSGIPPLNGFASKWMIYHGIIDFGASSQGLASDLWILWLALAVLGSAITLAVFMKYISGVFLGPRRAALSHVREVNVLMWGPCILLAIICIGFGVFATDYVVPRLFQPVVGDFALIGAWQSSFISFLVILSIIVGLLIYWIGSLKNMRTAESFVGGEKWGEEAAFKVTGFYEGVRNARFLRFMFTHAERRHFDIYDLTSGVVLYFNKVFSRAHTGILSDYALWLFAGLIVLLLILLV